MSIVYRGFTQEELDDLHSLLVDKAVTLQDVMEYYKRRPRCSCNGWGCSSEQEIRSQQGIFS